VPAEDAANVCRFLKKAKRRQTPWNLFLLFVLMVVGILGGHISLQNKQANWNILRIWTLAKLTHHTGLPLYAGPEMEAIRGHLRRVRGFSFRHQ
jgi:hypothetical protein